jgi:hypothetical protein
VRNCILTDDSSRGGQLFTRLTRKYWYPEYLCRIYGYVS